MVDGSGCIPVVVKSASCPVHCRVFRAFSHLSCASRLEVSDGVVLMPCCKCAKDRPCVRCYCVENGRPRLIATLGVEVAAGTLSTQRS